MIDQRDIPALGEALRFVQMSGVFYCLSDLSEPWGLELPPMADCVWFHAVTSGACHIQVDGEVRRLSAGDFVLVPHGAGHGAWGRQTAPMRPVFDLPNNYVNEQYAVLRHGGGGAQTTVVCGCIRFEQHPAVGHLFEALPPLICVEASPSTRADWMQATLALMAEETRTVRPGSDAVISRLCDVVVMQAIRAWIEQSPAAQTGWLGALKDNQIGTAIARIHADPARDWTVATLAAEAGMSRSAFAARFTSLVGEPAMRYVTRCRMHFAADLLQNSGTTVAGVAIKVGYASEAAFARAFKRVVGTTPGRVSDRRQSKI